MFCHAAESDDSTRLWQSLHPGELPEQRRLHVDQVNLAWMGAVLFRQLAGDRQIRFQPLYAPAGTVWADMGPRQQSALSGYVHMSKDETLEWLASLPAYRGRELPITTTS